MDFKIIAITPQTGCHEKFLKVLKRKQTYSLYNGYKVTETSVEETAGRIPFDLYQTGEGARINICAIVGKNGSGKSTVMELVYGLIYNIAWAGKILPEKDDDGYVIAPEKGLKARVTYQVDNVFYQLEYNTKGAWYRLQPKDKSKFGKWYRITQTSIRQIEHLFYSIVTNYSHHSLNSKYQRWLRYVFHKNDGYQTPIVINPFRNEGLIDMNIEEELTNARIVTNLLTLGHDGQQRLFDLAPNKTATHLKFVLNRDKINFKKEQTRLKNILEKHKNEILVLTFNAFKIDNVAKRYDTEDPNLSAAYIYILKKLYTITQRYRPFQKKDLQFIQQDKIGSNISYHYDEKKLVKLLDKIIERSSHITFKLQQAVNFVNNYQTYKGMLGKFVEIERFTTVVNEFRNRSKRKAERLISLIPPSFFSVDIKFGDNGTLKTLSSGERQSIYSSASWMYHMINLDSVREDEESGYRRYKCINLVFDEIELYYHPEMQRNFVANLLENFERVGLGKEWGVNCIMITHSPFILSDIPNHQTLFLTQAGLPDELSSKKLTFASNIHELLTDHFFLKDGTMGNFSQSKIHSLIKFLSEGNSNNNSFSKEIKWTRELAEQFIELISEPLVRQSLQTMHNQRFLAEREIEEQISILQQQLKNRRR